MFKKILLPKYLCPLHETDLIRLGKDNDGGYLIPKQSLNYTKMLYSFGLNDDFSFEKEFYDKTGTKIICYDHAVSWKFFVKAFLLGNFKSFFVNFELKSNFSTLDGQKWLLCSNSSDFSNSFSKK